MLKIKIYRSTNFPMMDELDEYGIDMMNIGPVRSDGSREVTLVFDDRYEETAETWARTFLAEWAGYDDEMINVVISTAQSSE